MEINKENREAHIAAMLDRLQEKVRRIFTSWTNSSFKGTVCNCCTVSDSKRNFRLFVWVFNPTNTSSLGLKYSSSLSKLCQTRFGKHFWKQICLVQLVAQKLHTVPLNTESLIPNGTLYPCSQSSYNISYWAKCEDFKCLSNLNQQNFRLIKLYLKNEECTYRNLKFSL